VSRVTVREALRVLETNGLPEIRVGARDGAFVTKPSKERGGRGHRRPPDHLRPAGDALATGDYSINLSAEFHERLAECAHNSAVQMLSHSIRGPLLMSLGRAQQTAPEMGPVGAKEHRKLVRAVQDRDAAKAAEIMRQHLGRTAARQKPVVPAITAEPLTE
jgi:GntR family transcriptional repressor for pyruvate dehydrogenase complex